MAGEVEVSRRWRLLDGIFLIAATAIVIIPTKKLLPEVIPVARQVHLLSIREYPYHEPFFRVPLRSSRMDSIRIQFKNVVAPVLGYLPPRWNYIDRKTGKRVSAENALANYVLTHSPPGGLGFALAGSSAVVHHGAKNPDEPRGAGLLGLAAGFEDDDLDVSLGVVRLEGGLDERGSRLDVGTIADFQDEPRELRLHGLDPTGAVVDDPLAEPELASDQWHVDIVLEILCLLDHADDCEVVGPDLDRLSDRVFVREQGLGDLRTDDDMVQGRGIVRIGGESPLVRLQPSNFHIGEESPPVHLQPSNRGVVVGGAHDAAFDGVSLVVDLFGKFTDRHHPCNGRNGGLEPVEVLVLQAVVFDPIRRDGLFHGTRQNRADFYVCRLRRRGSLAVRCPGRRVSSLGRQSGWHPSDTQQDETDRPLPDLR